LLTKYHIYLLTLLIVSLNLKWPGFDELRDGYWLRPRFDHAGNI
jgi:hypothetical protein